MDNELLKRSRVTSHHWFKAESIVIEPNSPLLNPFQIGTRKRPTYFKLRECLIDTGYTIPNGLSRATCQRYIDHNNSILALYTCGELVAAISTCPGSKPIIKKDNIINTHLGMFMLAATGVNHYIPDLKMKYGVNEIQDIPGQPMTYPRVTPGMLNEAIKRNHWTNRKIRVNSYNQIYETLSNGSTTVWVNAGSLKEVVNILIKANLITVDTIYQLNQESEIHRYIRGDQS